MASLIRLEHITSMYGMLIEHLETNKLPKSCVGTECAYSQTKVTRIPLEEDTPVIIMDATELL